MAMFNKIRDYLKKRMGAGIRPVLVFFRSGNGEVVGLISVTPVIVFFIVLFIDAARLSTMQAHLNYATYIACRAAAVSETYDTGYQRAAMAFSANMENAPIVDDSQLSADDIFVVEDSDEESEEEYISLDLVIVDEDGNIINPEKEGAWSKNNYVQLTISMKMNTMFDFLNGEKECKITQVIEEAGTFGTLDDEMWSEDSGSDEVFDENFY